VKCKKDAIVLLLPRAAVHPPDINKVLSNFATTYQLTLIRLLG